LLNLGDASDGLEIFTECKKYLLPIIIDAQKYHNIFIYFNIIHPTLINAYEYILIRQYTLHNRAKLMCLRFRKKNAFKLLFEK